MSDESCVNACVLPLRFPRRPGENPPALAKGETICFLADAGGISSDNRPALAHFNYRIGTYATIREWLLHQINQTPTLKNWTHRSADDPAIALLEGAAILGDILTFYQETYANEAFLRTAQWRDSIADLVRLLGYRLSPALGGNAVFAFEFKKNEAVVVPRGFPLKATLAEVVKPAEFQTVEEVTAYPWLNSFNLYRPLEDGDITPDTTEFHISYPDQLLQAIDLKVGDRIMVGDPDLAALFGSGSLPNAEILIVDAISELHGRKTYKIKGNLKRTANIEALFAFRIGRSFRHFGSNHPDVNYDGFQGSTSASMIDSNQAITSTATVNTSTNTTTTSSTIPKIFVPLIKPLFDDQSDPAISLTLGNLEFPLESEVKDVAVNSYLIFEFGYLNSYRENYLPHIHLIRAVKDVRSTMLSWGLISGTSSIITVSESLNSAILDPYYGGENNAWMYLIDALIHEATSPLFSFIRAKKETTASSGNKLHFYGSSEQVETLQERRIMLVKPGEEPQIRSITAVNSAAASGTEMLPQLHEVTLSADVAYADFPNQNPGVTVYGNLVDADEGKTLPESSLGSGDNTLVFQNFKIPKAPLTYHIVAENTPPATPAAEIYVDGRLWAKVDSFFGCTADEQIYIVREDAEGNSWVQFGDGKTGSRLPSGSKNVTAIYRTGAGAYGPLKTDSKVQAAAKLKNLDKVQMPGVASGGAAAEDGDNARMAAPGKLQSLGRIVSVQDFEAEAIAIPGVASAVAAWQLVDNVPSVVVTVLMETGRSAEIDAVRDTLLAYNSSRGAGRTAIVVIAGKRMYVALSLQYALQPGYRADLVEPAIRQVLGVNFALANSAENQSGLFSLRQRRFGAREYASSIEGTLQNVDGVLWARALAFTALADTDAPQGIALPASTPLQTVVTCDASHILSLYDKHLFLNVVSAEGS